MATTTATTGPVATGQHWFDLTHRMRRVAEVKIGSSGVSMARAKALLVVDVDGPIRPRALADQLDCAAASITDMVDGLERDGFVVRTQDPTDRRASLVAITPAGRTAARTARARKYELLDQIFGSLSDAEQRQLNAILARLSSAPILNGEIT